MRVLSVIRRFAQVHGQPEGRERVAGNALRKLDRLEVLGRAARHDGLSDLEGLLQWALGLAAEGDQRAQSLVRLGPHSDREPIQE